MKGSSYYSDALDAFNFRTPEFTNVEISNKTPGVSLTWSKTPFAEGYRIYRSETEDGGYTRIGTVKGSSTVTYLDTSGTDIGTTYYYKVRAYVTKSKKTVLSYVSDPRAITPGYAIMGESSTTAAKMANWYTARGGVYPEEIYSEYGAPTLKDFCKLVYNEAKAEGVKAEVLFAQICKIRWGCPAGSVQLRRYRRDRGRRSRRLLPGCTDRYPRTGTAPESIRQRPAVE